jgi:predicted dehydrogenase
MSKKQVRFALIGLGLMGKEFASAVARWCHLTDENLPLPVITGICNRNDEKSRKWFTDNFPSIEIITSDYRDLLSSDKIDAIYCAVPHHLHESMYIDIIRAGKHLLGEKPFGIDQSANSNILNAVRRHPGVVVRCSSEFTFYPGAKKVMDWIRQKRYGRLMEVQAGFHHSSDLDLKKPINWKRIIEFNGEYGCMGDLGFHIHLIPLRAGWKPNWIFADLQNIAEIRPDGKGNMVPCETWDNATVMCGCTDPDNGKDFSMTFETKRMMPGATNTWYIEVYGTEASFRFSTRDPRSFYYSVTEGKEQGWTRIDLGPQSYLPTITGGIFEFGFCDALQQMIAAFMYEFTDDPGKHEFRCGMPGETEWSHKILTAALESYKNGRRIEVKQ